MSHETGFWEIEVIHHRDHKKVMKVTGLVMMGFKLLKTSHSLSPSNNIELEWVILYTLFSLYFASIKFCEYFICG